MIITLDHLHAFELPDAERAIPWIRKQDNVKVSQEIEMDSIVEVNFNFDWMVLHLKTMMSAYLEIMTVIDLDQSTFVVTRLDLFGAKEIRDIVLLDLR